MYIFVMKILYGTLLITISLDITENYLGNFRIKRSDLILYNIIESSYLLTRVILRICTSS